MKGVLVSTSPVPLGVSAPRSPHLVFCYPDPNGTRFHSSTTKSSTKLPIKHRGTELPSNFDCPISPRLERAIETLTSSDRSCETQFIKSHDSDPRFMVVQVVPLVRSCNKGGRTIGSIFTYILIVKLLLSKRENEEMRLWVV